VQQFWKTAQVVPVFRGHPQKYFLTGIHLKIEMVVMPETISAAKERDSLDDSMKWTIDSDV
jgi:hypothetical protein